MMRPNYFLVLFLLLLSNSTLLFSQDLTMVETEENDIKVHELGLLMQSAIVDNNSQDYANAFDLNYIKGRLTNDKVKNKKQKDFQQGFTIGLLKSTKTFGEQIISAVENGAYYDFISYRYDQEAQTYFALFRFFDEESGINYHDYRINTINGEPKTIDLYIYLTGEYLSDTFDRIFRISMLNLNSPNEVEDGVNLDDFSNLISAIGHNGKGELQSAYDALEAIKGDLASEKFVQLIKIRIASQLDFDKYILAIEALKAEHEYDPTIYLTLVDYYLAKEEYDRAYDLIDNLQLETDDDFLYYFKGNLEYKRQNFENAENFFTYMMENYADFFQGYGGYVMAVTQQKKFDAAIIALEKLVDMEFDRDSLIQFIEEPDENDLNEFDLLVASEAYKNWKMKS